MRLPLVVLGALAYASLATWLARAAGGRWVWAACAVVALGLAAAGAARVGTANPYSRTARYDPLLFFAMTVVVLGAPAVASSLAALHLAAGDHTPRPAVVDALLSAGAALLAIPVGYVAAVAVEVLWPH